MSETAAVIEPPKQAHRTHSEESMVVRMGSLDNLLELAGEVIIVSSNINAMSRQIREGRPITRQVSEDIKDLAITSSRISSDLHNLVSNVRTVGMSDLFARFRRLARDTSRRLGKAIRFEVEGEDICIDKKMSEKIYDPIAHQIRNAMSHGIEDEATRRALGKDPVGCVQVIVRSTEHSTVIDVIDDGAGIDTDRVRRKIADMNLCDAAQIEKFSDTELFDYLYLPGFSTAETAGTTSGRGVGLDVVRSVMQEINGETRIESRRGQGTTFSFILPKVTAVNISDALLVRANETYFAFPIMSVVASASVNKSQVSTTTGRGKSIIYLGRILPLFDLLEVFGERGVIPDAQDIRVIIVEHKNRRVAYAVSDFLNPQKIVISEFVEKIRVPGLVGTAVLSGRQLAMVVDLPRLIEHTIGVETEAELRSALHRMEKGQAPGAASVPAEIKPEIDINEQTANSVLEPDEESKIQTPEFDRPDSAFLNEVETMLAELNKLLLGLDENRDRETADAVFRMMHSIKGNLTMCGAEEPASVAHKTETILARAREGSLELQDSIFDVLFDACGYLEEVVGALLKESRIPSVPDKLTAGLTEFDKKDIAAESAGVDPDSDQIVLDSTGEFYLSSRRREGAAMFRARLEFEPGDQPAFLVAYLILRRLQGVADVLGTCPAMGDIEAGLCDNGIAVLFCPREQRPDLLEKIEHNLRTYYGVTRFDANAFV